MTAHAPALHRALAVLAPPKRFQLLLLLLSGPDRSVSQLARAVRLSQSCTTRHLQALERAGLVKGQRDGKRVVFRTAPRDAAARAVIGSLGAATGLGGPPRIDPVLEAGIALGAVPVDSTAELEPPAMEPDEAFPRDVGPSRREPAVTDVPPRVAGEAQAAPESAMKSAPVPAPSRRRTDIEDFLL